MKKPIKNTSMTGSLNRATILLYAIARGSIKGISLTDLVIKTGLPRPTIHRVLDSLISIGWVIRDEETSRFNLGLELSGLGYSAIARNPLEQIAAVTLSELALSINQVVYMNIRVGLDMVCIGRYDSDSDINIGKGYVSMRGPLGMSPGCMGLFSTMHRQEVNKIIEANMSRYHRLQYFDETGFRKNVEDSITNGYGIYGNILIDRTMTGLGVAVCSPLGLPIAGIGTTFIAEWLSDDDQKNCVDKLTKAATAIEEKYFLNSKY